MNSLQGSGGLRWIAPLGMMSALLGCEVDLEGDPARTVLVSKERPAGRYQEKRRAPTWGHRDRTSRPAVEPDGSEVPDVLCERDSPSKPAGMCWPRGDEALAQLLEIDPDTLREMGYRVRREEAEIPGWVGSGPCGDCFRAVASIRRAALTERIAQEVAHVSARLDSARRDEARRDDVSIRMLACRQGECAVFFDVPRERWEMDDTERLAELAGAPWLIEMTGRFDDATASHAFSVDGAAVQALPPPPAGRTTHGEDPMPGDSHDTHPIESTHSIHEKEDER